MNAALAKGVKARTVNIVLPVINSSRMQTTQVQTCTNCNLIHELVEKLDFKLWEVAEASWNSKKYNLDYKPSSGDVSDLLHYKRILSKRLTNPDYPCAEFSIQDIAKELLGKVNSRKKCLCFSIPPTQ